MRIFSFCYKTNSWRRLADMVLRERTRDDGAYRTLLPTGRWSRAAIHNVNASGLRGSFKMNWQGSLPSTLVYAKGNSIGDNRQRGLVHNPITWNRGTLHKPLPRASVNKYQRKVGSILYVAVVTRLDVAFAASRLAHNRDRYPDCRAGRHMSLGVSKSKIDTITFTKTDSTHLDIAAASRATSLVSDARRALALQAARYHAAALSIRSRFSVVGCTLFLSQ